MTAEPRRTWPQQPPMLDRDFQAPIRSHDALDAPMATRTRRAPRALIWWTVATICTVGIAAVLLVEAL